MNTLITSKGDLMQQIISELSTSVGYSKPPIGLCISIAVGIIIFGLIVSACLVEAMCDGVSHVITWVICCVALVGCWVFILV